jgi:hypothetical protein
LEGVFCVVRAEALSGKIRPCDVHNLANSLKLRKASGLDGIPNESSKKTIGTSDTFIESLSSNCPIFQNL